MRKLLIFLALIVLFVAPASTIEYDKENTNIFEQIQSGIIQLADQVDINEIMNQLGTKVDEISDSLDSLFQKGESEDINLDPISLTAPNSQPFSIANIELGDHRNEVEKIYGSPKRVSKNEYGVNWETYHENYFNFFMISYNEEQKVIAMYTNQNLLSSEKGIKIGSNKEEVLEQLGEPIKGFRKGLVMYQLPEDRSFDVFHLNGSYITIFYDEHEENSVTAIQIIDEKLENKKSSIYAQGNEELREGFEYQLFDLTNAIRVQHGLNILTWDEHVRITARHHSEDMAENNYFSHTNLNGQSPFDRMKEDDIFFMLAGENLAYGQYSSIYAHEGLMNSKGHRENILKKDYKYLGVGVAFNNESQPYFTENFYAK